MTAIPTLYKIVGPNGECRNGGSGDWPLPVGDRPGEWRTIEGPLVACQNALHLTDAEHAHSWGADHPNAVVYRVEVDGECVDFGGKWGARRVRLLPRRLPDGLAETIKAAERKADRARRKADRVEAAARKAYEAAVPTGWRGYLTATRGVVSPLLTAYREAETVYRETGRKERAAYHRAAAELAALRSASLPL